MPLLKKGRELVSNVTDHHYRVTSHLVARGGFGEVSEGVLLDHHLDPCGDEVIDVVRTAVRDQLLVANPGHLSGG